MRLARLSALALLSLTVSGGLASGEPTRAHSAGLISGVTTFEASASGSATVILERNVTISRDGLFTSEQVEIAGTGRVTGVVLVRDLAQAPEEFVDAAVFIRFGSCWSPGCTPEGPYSPAEMVHLSGFEIVEQSTSKTTYELPAGRYRAYAITDDGPARVTLRLGELGGTTHIGIAGGPNPVVALRTVEPTGLSREQAPYHEAGGTARIATGPTLLAHSEGYTASPHIQSEQGTCYYLNALPPQDMYLPGCPGAHYRNLSGANATTLDTLYAHSYGTVIASMPGEWNFGRYRAQIAGENRYRLTQLWVDLGA